MVESSKQFNTRLPMPLHDEVMRFVDERGMSQAEFTRRAFTMYLQSQGVAINRVRVQRGGNRNSPTDDQDTQPTTPPERA